MEDVVMKMFDKYREIGFIFMGAAVAYFTPKLLNLIGSRIKAKKAIKIIHNTDANPSLEEHTKEFRKEIIKVTDGVHVAVGYALANSILIEAPNGLIVVDTTESYEAGKEVYHEFRKISAKPISSIILTHNHADHAFGAKAFYEDENPKPAIWAHHTFPAILRRVMLIISGAIFRRGMRQFGALLPSVVNSGIGGSLRQMGGYSMGAIMPDHLLKDEKLDIDMAGLTIRLMHMPGETADQICVWIESKNLLIPADNIYRAFPNLYAIRGTATRDQRAWVNSLDKMRALKPQFLVPCHTRPVIGATKIETILRDYRDAIQYVHDQTVRWMNTGMFPDEIVQKVSLPANLAKSPFLQEFYGTVAWSVRGAFNQYLGWFGGDPRELNPLPPLEKATNLVNLAGGIDDIVTKAQIFLQSNQPQWALELASAAIEVEPANKDAKKIKIDALKALAETQISANGRNYYLTCALETANLIENVPSKATKKWGTYNITIQDVFSAMPHKLKAEECHDLDQIVFFDFTDSGVQLSLHIRNGILEIVPGKLEPVLVQISCEEMTWRQIVAEDTSAALAVASGALKVDGKLTDLVAFMDHFIRTL